MLRLQDKMQENPSASTVQYSTGYLPAQEHSRAF
jgi:hypothetical protein